MHDRGAELQGTASLLNKYYVQMPTRHDCKEVQLAYRKIPELIHCNECSPSQKRRTHFSNAAAARHILDLFKCCLQN